MKRRTRSKSRKPTVGLRIAKLSFVTILTFGLLAGLLVASVPWLTRRYIEANQPTSKPEIEVVKALQQEGVITNNGNIASAFFMKRPGVDNVTDIVFRNLDGKPGNEIGIAGQAGAIITDETGNIIHKVSFPYGSNKDLGPRVPRTNVVFVDVNKDTRTEYFDRGSWGFPVSLLAYEGSILWEYGDNGGAGPGVDDAVFGDMDGDGILEIGVGFNGWGGVHLIDSDGQKLWERKGGNIWHLEMVDTNDDGLPELVHSDAGGHLWIRDREGEAIHILKSAGYFSSFTIGSWPPAETSTSIFRMDAGAVKIIDFFGKEIDRYLVPDFDKRGDVLTITGDIHGDSGKETLLAIRQSAVPASLLIILDENKKELFSAVIKGNVGALCVVPGSKKDQFFVGAGNQVKKYFVAE